MPLKSDPEKEKWMAIQSELDVEKKNFSTQKQKVFPFNPNFISDYKGYKLGMSVAEIDRLHAFRRKNSYVNSAEEFQKVTLVSDSLLNELAPYFKFPSWVAKRATQTRGSYKQAYSKQQHLFVQQDINLASKERFNSGLWNRREACNKTIVRKRTLSGFFEHGTVSIYLGA